MFDRIFIYSVFILSFCIGCSSYASEKKEIVIKPTALFEMLHEDTRNEGINAIMSLTYDKTWRYLVRSLNVKIDDQGHPILVGIDSFCDQDKTNVCILENNRKNGVLWTGYHKALTMPTALPVDKSGFLRFFSMKTTYDVESLIEHDIETKQVRNLYEDLMIFLDVLYCVQRVSDEDVYWNAEKIYKANRLGFLESRLPDVMLFSENERKELISSTLKLQNKFLAESTNLKEKLKAGNYPERLYSSGYAAWIIEDTQAVIQNFLNYLQNSKERMPRTKYVFKPGEFTGEIDILGK